jgi:hypothetical protein
VSGASAASRRIEGAIEQRTPHEPQTSTSTHRSTSPAASTGSFISDTPSRSSTHSSRYPLAWTAAGAGPSASAVPSRGLTSDPSTYTSPTSASSTTTTSTTSTNTANPSAPVTVNTPLPVMRLPSPLSGRSSRRAQAGPAQAPSGSAPDPSAFNFSALLSDLLRDPDAQKDLDAIAEICGRSRLSRANEYTAHREPVGPGALRVAGDAEDVEIAGAYSGALAGAEHHHHAPDDGDGSLHVHSSSALSHFPPYYSHTAANNGGLEPVEEAASETSRAASHRDERRSEERSSGERRSSERRSSALDIFSGDTRRQRRLGGSPGDRLSSSSPGRTAAAASASVATADGMAGGMLDSGSPGRGAVLGRVGVDARGNEQRAEGRLRWLAGG